MSVTALLEITFEIYFAGNPWENRRIRFPRQVSDMNRQSLLYRLTNTQIGGLSKLPLMAILITAPAEAYVGPGLGAGTLGVILGLLGSILIAIFAFF